MPLDTSKLSVADIDLRIDARHNQDGSFKKDATTGNDLVDAINEATTSDLEILPAVHTHLNDDNGGLLTWGAIVRVGGVVEGSNLTHIETRAHNDLNSKEGTGNGSKYWHLGDNQYQALTGAGGVVSADSFHSHAQYALLAGGNTITGAQNLTGATLRLPTGGSNPAANSELKDVSGVLKYKDSLGSTKTFVHEVIPGNGLTGVGALSDSVTLNVGQGDGISIDANAVNVDSTVIRKNGSVAFTNPVAGVDPEDPEDLATKGYIDALASVLSGQYGAPVADLAALKAVPPDERADRQLRLVDSTGSLYRFQGGDASAANEPDLVVPNDESTVAGRWIRVQSQTQDHNALTNLNAADYRHLTAAQYTNFGTLTAGSGSDADALHKHDQYALKTRTIEIAVNGVGLVVDVGAQNLTANRTFTLTGSVVDHDHQASGSNRGGQLDHGLALTGLGDDDHTQYVLVNGTRSMTGSLTFTGAADRAIGPLPGAGAGVNFLVGAGTAAAGTNLAGGNLVLTAGGSTGNAGSGMGFWTATPGSSGTGTNTPTQKALLDGAGTLHVLTSIRIGAINGTGVLAALQNIALTAGDGLTGGGDLSASRTFNVVGGDGIEVGTDDVSVDATVVRTSRSITAGNGLTGGGDLSDNRTLDVGAGDGISVAANAVAVDSTVARKNADNAFSVLQTFAEGLDITNGKRFGLPFGAAGGVAEGDLWYETTGDTLRYRDGGGLDAILVRSTIAVASGGGLTGGGDLSTSRTLAVGAGDGIAVNADDVAVDATVVRTSRTVATGSGLTGGGDLSANRTLAANFTTSGGYNGTATTVARGDHSHASAAFGVPPNTDSNDPFSMAWTYDSKRKRAILYNSRTDDTWEFDGVNWTLVATTGPGAGTAQRYYIAMAYDPLLDKVILFGGLADGPGFGTSSDETWEFNPATAAWTQKSPATVPTERDSHATVFDAGVGAIIMFGGEDDNSDTLADMWKWTGSNWVDLNPTTPPAARGRHSMVYDPVRQRTILFGGRTLAVSESGSGRNDLSEYNSGTNTWTQILADNNSVGPSDRRNTSMVYVASQNQVLLYGGRTAGGSTTYSDTWEYDGASGSWTNLSPVRSPGNRAWSLLAQCDLSGNPILFGGITDTGGTLADSNTWSWNGSIWVL